MRFELEARITFSEGIRRAAEDIERILTESRGVLTKGAPKGRESEAARLLGWEIAGNELALKLTSGRYVRAHDALLRLAKLLAAELGRKHKIGVRGISATKYTISLPATGITEEVRGELAKLPCEVTLGETWVEVSLENVGEAELRGRVVDRLVSTVQEILSRPREIAAPPRVVREGKKLKHPFKEDPFEVARKLGWVVEFPGRGQWTYTEPYAKLLRVIEKLIIREIAGPLGFEEVMFPKLIPLEVMRRMPGYLDGVPEGMYYVCPPPRDPEAFSAFKQGLKLAKQVSADELKRVVKDPGYVLAPAQCEAFYQIFSSGFVQAEKLPVKQFDRSGWTYRWEGGGVEGLIRTQEFRRIEFVMMGTPEDVVSIRDGVLERSIELLDKLGVEWRLTVATPFYMREGGIEEDISDSRRVATYDLEVVLPYKEGWLEIGSYNVHRTKFTESFKIKEAKGRELWTGCCGFGTSRWVVGFLAQHGFDPDSWPELVRELVGTLPGPSEGLQWPKESA
jgi:seryl-tRNA synthetase